MRNGLRIVAVLLNIGWLVFFCYLFVNEGPNRSDDWWVVIIVMATLGINLLALARPWPLESDSWLGLWLKRKRLEERKRIKDLESS